MADETRKTRDWIALLIVPIALLLLNWMNTSRTEGAARSRELKKERAEVITQLLQDQWDNGVKAEVIAALPHQMSNGEFRTAKQEFNLNESHLYVDRLKIEILFPDENGKKLARAIRSFIALGNDRDAIKEYGDTFTGKYKEAKSEVQTLSLKALRDNIGADQIEESW